FKRLESSGLAFQQSIERHILRNFVFFQAIEQKLPLPIGPQDAALLDAHVYDEDAETIDQETDLFDPEEGGDEDAAKPAGLNSIADYKSRAAEVYAAYSSTLKTRFKWLRS